MKPGLLLFWAVVAVAGHQQYCRCECNGKSLVEPIEKCGKCTVEFCNQLDAKLCQGDADEEDRVKPSLIISCYQIESVKESAIIYGFSLVVIGLMVYGLVKR